MDSKLRKMAILASMAVILLVALLVMYVNREQFTAASGPPASGTQNAGAGDGKWRSGRRDGLTGWSDRQ